MNAALTDDVWKRRGISILWDGDTLTQFDAASKVISLRRFFELYEADWPEDDIPFVNNDAVMVAGLDVMIDALEPDEAVDWVEQQVYTKIQSFQSCFDSCALIFWMAEKSRWKENAGENSYDWWLSGKYKQQTFPIGRCIWNGAQNGVRRIETPQGQWLGLYHQRIS
ncbi:MAG: hypothetical protein ABL919_04175 [Methylococcales bacterium]